MKRILLASTALLATAAAPHSAPAASAPAPSARAAATAAPATPATPAATAAAARGPQPAPRYPGFAAQLATRRVLVSPTAWAVVPEEQSWAEIAGSTPATR